MQQLDYYYFIFTLVSNIWNSEPGMTTPECTHDLSVNQCLTEVSAVSAPGQSDYPENERNGGSFTSHKQSDPAV
jgi:hypothetical protein